MNDPIDSTISTDQTPVAVDPGSPQNPDRAGRAALIRSRAEANAKAALRNRTQFERHEVSLALISAFVSGADLAAGESTEQPELAGARAQVNDLAAQRDILQDENDALNGRIRSLEEDKSILTLENDQLRADIEKMRENLDAAQGFARREGESEEDFQARLSIGFSQQPAPEPQSSQQASEA